MSDYPTKHPKRKHGAEASAGAAAGAAAAAGSSAAAGNKAAGSRKHTSAGGGGSRPHKSKKQRIMCILIPLMILAILGGIGAAIGITMASQRAALQKAAAASAAAKAGGPAGAGGVPAAPPSALAFKVNVMVPPDEEGKPPPSCSELLAPQNSRGRLEVRSEAMGCMFLCLCLHAHHALSRDRH